MVFNEESVASQFLLVHKMGYLIIMAYRMKMVFFGVAQKNGFLTHGLNV